MRIAGKHLRYTLEIFAPIYGHALDPHIRAMKNIQDLLGEIHDNDVWISWLPEFIALEGPGLRTILAIAVPSNGCCQACTILWKTGSVCAMRLSGFPFDLGDSEV
jgi:hypothetical protein